MTRTPQVCPNCDGEAGFLSSQFRRLKEDVYECKDCGYVKNLSTTSDLNE